MTSVLTYSPANLPRSISIGIGAAAPALLDVPSTVVNLGIVAAGVVTGLVGFQYRKKPLGVIVAGAGASVAGAGLVFMLLDLFGRRPA